MIPRHTVPLGPLRHATARSASIAFGCTLFALSRAARKRSCLRRARQPDRVDIVCRRRADTLFVL